MSDYPNKDTDDWRRPLSKDHNLFLCSRELLSRLKASLGVQFKPLSWWNALNWCGICGALTEALPIGLCHCE